ncbi:MAG: DUF3617 domain-containing protein [Alphaproteobacteria bacterium]|nr:DUF3617 domain-containing protein [Alphaproteobacteria bacterium]
MKSTRFLALGAALLAVAPLAWAGHGKVGLWEITIHNNSGHMSGMPDMSKLPPEARAQMQSHHAGMMGPNGMTVRHCMTAAEVNNDKPDLAHNSQCKASNIKMSGQTFSADIVCSGKTMNGKGHVQIAYTSPEHYTGSETMSLIVDGQPMQHDMTMEGKWVSAVCPAGVN